MAIDVAQKTNYTGNTSGQFTLEANAHVFKMLTTNIYTNSELWYLFKDSSIVKLSESMPSTTNLIAVFTSKEDCYKYYPELFI